jgi:branched-chain amino acid transport system permease protein
MTLSGLKRELGGLSLGLAVLAILPVFIQDTYLRHLLIMIFVYGMVAASWDLSLGYGGVFNFGHLALFGVGLYTYALLSKQLGVDPWLALAAAGGAAVIAAGLMVIPILRLKGIYVVLLSFAFSQLILQVIVSQSDYTGGNQGMVMVPALKLGDHNMMRDKKLAYYYIALTLLSACLLFLRIFVRSALGKSIVALRDNEEYAVSRGISLGRQRLLTLTGSALFTGIAGGFYGGYFRNTSTDVFGIDLTTLILSMVLLGGRATIYGPLLASLVLTLLSEVTADIGVWRPIIIGAVIILVLLVYPGGLAGALSAGWRRLSAIRTPRRQEAAINKVAS